MGKLHFKNYMAWYGKSDSPQNNENSIRKWMEDNFLYEVILPIHAGDLRDIGDITNNKWSAYASQFGDISHYFFKSEIDVMAFKLKFT